MKILKSTIIFFQIIGIDLIKIIKNIKGIPKFLNDYRTYIKQVRRNNLFPLKKIYPILTEWNESAGSVKSHYFIQDLFVAQLIFKANPKRHIDIGSRIDGFVSNLASFREVEVLDIRELNSSIVNIKFTKADLMQVPSNLKESCDSISSLHAIEHFGLGRYGDPIDADGYLKGINSIYEILKIGGVFYFSVPIGLQRIEFNAHRVFSLLYLFELLSQKFEIISFSYINDQGDFYKFCKPSDDDLATNFNCNYGCGIFELKKIDEKR